MRNQEFTEGSGSPRDLSHTDKQVIDFARTAPTNPAKRLNAIRETFDMSETRYFMKLNGLLDHPGALEYDPVTVNRYRRIRNKTADKRQQ